MGLVSLPSAFPSALLRAGSQELTKDLLTSLTGHNKSETLRIKLLDPTEIQDISFFKHYSLPFKS